MIVRVAAYLGLLLAVGKIVSEYPWLWELAVAAAIGSAYFIFFRPPPSKS